jgi:hypothetical protein
LKDFATAELDGEMQSDFHDAVSALEDCARHMAQAGLYIEIGTPLFWPYLISEKILASMQRLEPHCLVLLAYFSVFMTLLDESCWHIRGWGTQLLGDIEEQLAGQTRFLEWLRWPRHNTQLLKK